MSKLQLDSKILITGAAGFIASCMAAFLNKQGYHNLILMDDFSRMDKLSNHQSIVCLAKIERKDIDTYLTEQPALDFVIHFGARTDTTEMDYSIHETLNVIFSKKLWLYCTQYQIPMIYASSAATYGGGEFGYEDNHQVVEKLKPLNPYGVSKQVFDLFVLSQQIHPPHWYGLKFFNVYGPNEYHKGRMASVIFHAYRQIKNTGSLQLFRSHHPDYRDGGQMRDFIYVQDILSLTYWLMQNLPESGLYNAGTGKANTFLQLANAVFSAMKLEPNIQFVDTPIDIRDKYQYFTEANMNKLRNAGYKNEFTTIEAGVKDYISNYLTIEKNYK
ncbi:MAG: ADP-glyceromanno-heptose 6-epimerase [Bacteroidetes bacterium]|nr:ADP-glyceromanno-heptose 6-epimerase [Bacteroidota bacterium]